jgi:hypothetical protein
MRRAKVLVRSIVRLLGKNIGTLTAENLILHLRKYDFTTPATKICRREPRINRTAATPLKPSGFASARKPSHSQNFPAALAAFGLGPVPSATPATRSCRYHPRKHRPLPGNPGRLGGKWEPKSQSNGLRRVRSPFHLRWAAQYHFLDAGQARMTPSPRGGFWA